MTEFEHMQEFSYLDGVADGLKESRNDVIEELEKIKAEIEDLDLGFVDEDYRAGVARGIMEFNKILNKHIEELKGESKEYETEVITRGNCMICGKELTEGLFFCKECENKTNSRK